MNGRSLRIPALLLFPLLITLDPNDRAKPLKMHPKV
jgi:hypothetical protein